jgi:hypothetical protein
MAPPAWEMEAIIAAAFAGPALATVLLAYGLATVTHIKGVVIGLICGLLAPICVAVFAWITPLTKPDPRLIDGPAYVLVGLIYWALLLLPTCLAASSLGTWLRRRSAIRPRHGVR